MYFAFDEDERDFQRAVATVLADRGGLGEVRFAMARPSGYDRELWLALAELGVLSSGAADDENSLVHLAIAAEELGASLFVGPFLSGALAGVVLAAVAPDDPANELAKQVWTGAQVAAVIDTVAAAGLTAEGASGPGSVRLTGHVGTVLDGCDADVFLICAAGSWYEVDASDGGIERLPVACLDQTRRLAAVNFTSVPAREIGLARGGADLGIDLARVQQVLIAADQVGVARAAARCGIEHAKTRVQFGRPVGSFQAIQHSYAEVALAVECAWAATFEAAWLVTHEPVDSDQTARSDQAVSLAAATAGDAALDTAELTMQVRAGIGFTWDDPAHLYLKRAKANRLLFGLPDQHRAELATSLGL